ncbi:hypothetical protein DCO58_05250 [Helicobacter saguini]|uniref:Uncharacterized protein n=1 Tax=Helicobacter saguini TaxID=1548018 RepID=A0A347VT44_9HELI|nr:hypothetical protein [Helicobacter saguini]MWV62244.1 hypothetical protein [Helicobacter saguini]MWV67083.1 hypothetical protein [Helicobacter saguini]MWV69433.1 hypothetical protein [Helicobacter saguini]MWV71014.1 hypothetical protein [Helicobacter saguini]TLD91752.1 hypothetical protein LS64_011375 [Helicobacter saguini]
MAISWTFIERNLERYFGDRVYVFQHIPQDKLNEAMNAFDISQWHDIAGVYYDTIFGACDEGVVFTGLKVVFKTDSTSVREYEYEKIHDVEMRGKEVFVNFERDNYLYEANVSYAMMESYRPKFANFMNDMLKACRFDVFKWLQGQMPKLSNNEKAKEISYIMSEDFVLSQIALGFMPDAENTTDIDGNKIWHSEIPNKEEDGKAVGLYEIMPDERKSPKILFCEKAMYMKYKPNLTLHIKYYQIKKAEIQGGRLILNVSYSNTFDISHVIDPLDYQNFVSFIDKLVYNLENFGFKDARDAGYMIGLKR